MNLSELSFKVITMAGRMTKLHDILKSLGVVLPINYNNTVFVICDEGHFQFGGSINYFDKFLQEEITFDQAIYLLNKCSNDIKESKLGKFIEYDIAPDGKFDSGRTYWADFNFEENENSIFAGWLWENPKNPNCKTWSMNRKGIKGSRMISNCNEWEYPIIPKKIRYWVKE